MMVFSGFLFYIIKATAKQNFSAVTPFLSELLFWFERVAHPSRPSPPSFKVKQKVLIVSLFISDSKTKRYYYFEYF